MLLLAPLTACETSVTTSDGWPLPPEPRAARTVPEGVRPTRVLLVHAPKADDSDGNGFPDTMTIAAGLFTNVYASSVEASGTFTFTLYRLGEYAKAGAEPIAVWTFGPEALPGHRDVASYGPCYRFRLSLLEANGTDRLPSQRGDIRGRFEPADGGPAATTSDEVRPILIGRGG